LHLREDSTRWSAAGIHFGACGLECRKRRPAEDREEEQRGDQQEGSDAAPTLPSRRGDSGRCLEGSMRLLRAKSRFSERASERRAGRLRRSAFLRKELQIGEACAGTGAGDELQIRLAKRAHELRVPRDQTKREAVSTHRHRLSPR